MIQASTGQSRSPLVAEAAAFSLTAVAAKQLNIQGAAFLTDNVTLAKAAATRSISSTQVRWDIRQHLAAFFYNTVQSDSSVYHVRRDLNGVVHDCAHQALSSSSEPAFARINQAHRQSTCVFLPLLLQQIAQVM